MFLRYKVCRTDSHTNVAKSPLKFLKSYLKLQREIILIDNFKTVRERQCFALNCLLVH